jgi:hypothetical protein
MGWQALAIAAQRKRLTGFSIENLSSRLAKPDPATLGENTLHNHRHRFIAPDGSDMPWSSRFQHVSTAHNNCYHCVENSMQRSSVRPDFLFPMNKFSDLYLQPIPTKLFAFPSILHGKLSYSSLTASLSGY